MIIYILFLDVEQLRLDFDNFMIAGPSMATATTLLRKVNSGDATAKATNPLAASVVKLSAFGQCLTDRFSVSNPDGPNPPTICGINSGEHSKYTCGWLVTVKVTNGIKLK